MLSGGSVAYVGDYFPYEQRGWANGWVMSGVAFGQVAGVPLGKVLAAGFGYRWPFLMFAVPMGLATLLIWHFVPQPDTDLDDKDLTPRRFLNKYVGLLQESYIAAAVGAYFLMFCGIGLFTSFLPSWLETTIGVSSYSIALLFAIGGSANVMASPLAGRLSDEIGRKPLVVGSSLALALFSALAPVFIVGFSSAAGLFFLAMVAVGVRISPLQSLLTALVRDQERGLLMGLAMSIGQAGFGVGSFLASATVGAYGYASNAAAGAVVTVVMAGLVHWGLPEPSLSSTDDPPTATAPDSPTVAEA